MKLLKFSALVIFSFASLLTLAQTNETPTIQKQLEGINKNWVNTDYNDPILSKRYRFSTDKELIQLHLSLVETKLRKKENIGLNQEQIKNRKNTLNLLHDYWVNGTFPINKFHTERTPYFIDHIGTACAVGQLIIESGNEPVAQTIAKENNYAYVSQLNQKYPQLKNWADEYGFTVDELAWIQPGYSRPNVKTILASCDENCTQEGDMVASHTNAPDSIIDIYMIDAQQIAMRWIYQDSLPDIDSVDISTHVDTVLKALLAIYNAPNFSARDTVFSIFDIHTSKDSIVHTNSFQLAIFSPEMIAYNITGLHNPFWVKNLQNDSALSGHPIIDSLITNYDFSYTGDSEVKDPNDNIVTYSNFATPNNYNIPLLIQDIDTIIFAIYNLDTTDSNIDTVYASAKYTEVTKKNKNDYDYWMQDNIQKDIQFIKKAEDYVQLHFSLTYLPYCMTCPGPPGSLTTSGRSWIFNIYDNYTVEFVRSYGQPIYIVTDIENMEKPKINIHPNPFTDYLSTNGIKPNTEYIIYNILGEQVLNGQTENNVISNLDNLPKGQYFLQLIENGEIISTNHLIKN